ncbi:hypothetical protein GCM10009067_34070 [Haloarcula sebkhae]|nr:hypothetical protein GCM10009067_34070 [Haloarcula sebkhae]
MDIDEIEGQISAAADVFPTRFDITVEIVVFLRPDEDLADCLYP